MSVDAHFATDLEEAEQEERGECGGTMTKVSTITIVARIVQYVRDGQPLEGRVNLELFNNDPSIDKMSRCAVK